MMLVRLWTVQWEPAIQQLNTQVKVAKSEENCASGFGVCYVAVVDSCNGGNIALNNSYIVNPGFPNTVSDSSASSCGTSRPLRTNRRLTGTSTMYTLTISKAVSDIEQLRLDLCTLKHLCQAWVIVL